MTAIRSRLLHCSAAVVAIAGAVVTAGTLRSATTTPSAIEAAMAEAVAAGEIAGAVTLVADRDGVRHLGAVGRADLEADRPLSEDALFWIASMTKPVAGTAVMMLVEEGKLALADPVAKHLPEFAALEDADGNPAEVTVAQLLSHTSGLAELSGEESARIRTLAELVPLVVAKPVRFPPGSRWAYCQTGINTAARLVEVLSGVTFPEFLDDRLFGPLGMADTTFFPTREQAARLATSYRKGEDGSLGEAEIFVLHGRPASSRERYPMAHAGLFTTAADYGRFCRMILRGGELDGRRYLTPDSVRTMTSVHTGDLATGFTPGNGWGIGWCVVREPQGVTAVLSPGSFGHGGAYGTQAWIDPEAGRVFLLMVQRANFPNADASEVRRTFQQAAVTMLVEEDE